MNLRTGFIDKYQVKIQFPIRENLWETILRKSGDSLLLALYNHARGVIVMEVTVEKWSLS